MDLVENKVVTILVMGIEHMLLELVNQCVREFWVQWFKKCALADVKAARDCTVPPKVREVQPMSRPKFV